MTKTFRAIWHLLVSIKYSALAALAAAVFGLLGMGITGLALYYAVSFALPPAYPNMETAHGDWVWPAMIAVGMAWSAAFLLAGWLNRYLTAKNTPLWWRRFIYLAVLWLWALLLWWLTLNANQ